MIVILRIMAIAILLAGGLHLLLGLGAEALLGVTLSPETLSDPSLDSQNRFYGTSYVLYGILLWICTRDMRRYASIFSTLLLMTFAGGLSRIISAMIHGWPAPAITALAAVELLLPPAILWWQKRSRTLS